MNYFNALPQIAQVDPNGNHVVSTNIMARSYFLPTLKNNLNIMYQYDIKEGDTPENIAYRYYGTVDRFWVILMANGIIDPQWQWPLTSNQFNDFMVNKYSEAANSTDPNVILAYTQSTVHHYEQDLITFNNQDDQKQTITTEIGVDQFNSSTDSFNTFILNGVVITRQTNYRVVSLYDYEIGKNESNRKISILKDTFVNLAEKQLQSLMT